jgi:hypothetical protein
MNVYSTSNSSYPSDFAYITFILQQLPIFSLSATFWPFKQSSNSHSIRPPGLKCSYRYSLMYFHPLYLLVTYCPLQENISKFWFIILALLYIQMKKVSTEADAIFFNYLYCLVYLYSHSCFRWCHHFCVPWQSRLAFLSSRATTLLPA